MTPATSTRSERGPTPAGYRWRTEGARIFRTLGEKQIVIASLLNVTVSHVCQLASGARRPSLDLAVAIEKKLGIAVVLWTEPESTSLGVNRTSLGSAAQLGTLRLVQR